MESFNEISLTLLSVYIAQQGPRPKRTGDLSSSGPSAPNDGILNGATLKDIAGGGGGSGGKRGGNGTGPVNP